MLFNELPVAFPWYENIEQQNRYNENVEPICDYRLISPYNSLLPFQFTKTYGPAMTSWTVHEVNTGAEVADISASLSQVNVTFLENKWYHTYHGGVIDGLNLQYGFYYSKITFSGGGGEQFSEMFFIPEDRFLSNSSNSNYLKILWYNNTDLAPIYYNDLDGSSKPKFKNVLYLDTFIHASEPEINEELERDGDENPIAIFQRVVIRYLISTHGPDFLKRALHLLPLHDFVEVTTKKGIRSGNIKNILVTSELEAGGALSIIELKFEQNLAIVKKACGVNMGDGGGTTEGVYSDVYSENYE